MWVWLGSFLTQTAGKVIVLVLCILGVVCGPIAAIQSVRLNGLSLFGWYAIDGYRPMYENIVKKDDATKLAAVTASLKLMSAQDDVLKKSNADLVEKNTNLQITVQTLQGRTPQYVSKEVLTACLPLGLGMLIDAAGTGVSLPEVSAEARKHLATCAPISMSNAIDKLVWNLSIIPEDTARIEHASAEWDALAALNDANKQK